MKKGLKPAALAAVIAILLCTLCLSAQAAPKLEDGVLTISSQADIPAPTVPSGGPYYDNSTIHTLVIQGNVRELKRYSFCYMNALKEVSLPEGVTAIGRDCFQYCQALETINIPSTVSSIGQEAFAYCKNLRTIELPEGLERIEHSTFDHCAKLYSIYIPASVTFIDYSAFESCPALQIVHYGGTQADMEQIVWGTSPVSGNDNNGDIRKLTWNCQGGADSGSCGQNLTWHVLDGDYLVISGDGAMRDYSPSSPAPWAVWPDINTIALDEGVTSVGQDAFSGLEKVGHVYLPLSLERVEEGAFPVQLRDGLWSGYGWASYPGTYEDYEKLTFESGNTGLLRDTVIALDNQTYACGEKLFWKLQPEISGFEATLLLFGDGALEMRREDMGSYYPWDPRFSDYEIIEVLIGEGVTYLPPGVFNEDSIRSVSIGTGMQGYTFGTFMGAGLSEFYVSEENPYLSARDGLLMSRDETVLYRCGGSVTPAVRVPDTVTRIQEAAFVGCDGLETVTLPDAWVPENEVDVMIFPDIGLSVGTRIECSCGSWAHAYAVCLGYDTELTGGAALCLPQGLTALSEEALAGSGARAVIAPESLSVIGPKALSNMSALGPVILLNPFISIADDALQGSPGAVLCFPGASGLSTQAQQNGWLILIVDAGG